ncbi:MAG: hypothetical protein ABIR17_09855 [Pseudolysinimonas sp.]|uniref:hypothetical protein n=1 Tax=Pseudolysinimonas sp. TaxID=2680009 RepID=UPI003263FBD8
MGFLDRLFGTQQDDVSVAPRRRSVTDDERVVQRYRYLLRTAPSETIEQVHAQAFGNLSDTQRAQIYEELSRGTGTGERPLSSEPATLARAASRAESRIPGSLERILAGPTFSTSTGSSTGTGVVSPLLVEVAEYVVGSALVSAFLPWDAAYDQASSRHPER